MESGLKCLCKERAEKSNVTEIIEHVSDDIPVQTPITRGVFTSGTGRTKLEHSSSISGKSPYV